MASRACLAAAIAAGARTGGVSAFSKGGNYFARGLSTTLSSGGRRGFEANNVASSFTGASFVTGSIRQAWEPTLSRGGKCNKLYGCSVQLKMASTDTADASPRRVKTAEADISDEPVSIKGWVKTVRKQKTLAFVEVNDGSNMSGIQCVVPFDGVDEATLEGKFFYIDV